jgi:hypothetical protein
MHIFPGWLQPVAVLISSLEIRDQKIAHQLEVSGVILSKRNTHERISIAKKLHAERRNPKNLFDRSPILAFCAADHPNEVRSTRRLVGRLSGIPDMKGLLI